MRSKNTGRIRSHQHIVAIIFHTGLIAVVMQTDHRRIARKNEVLTEVIGDQRVLVAIVKRVQSAVCVLLRLIEPDQIELIPIGQSRAEQTHCAIGVGKHKTSKVTYKGLRTGTD